MVVGQLIDEVCPCCGGDKTQVNNQTGMRELCKCCGGKGRRQYMSDGSPIITCKVGE
jgi:hypothetical protein